MSNDPNSLDIRESEPPPSETPLEMEMLELAPEVTEQAIVPSLLQVSGLYAWPKKVNWWGWREELRLDVDGRYPQMTVSGRAENGLANHVHWIADLSSSGRNKWTGSIWYKEGSHAAQFLYTNVEVKSDPGLFPHQRKAKVTFSGGGAVPRKRTYRFKSSQYHPVEFEYDTVKNTFKVTDIDTCDHPNRPPGMPCENLTVEEAFERSGFRVTKTGGDGVIPLSNAEANGTWSDAEMHDAMQAFWTRFASHAQWSMWVLFAAQHDRGFGLGGIMFDDIGPNHRQGTAIFNDSFIGNAPAGDPDPVAWAERMRFWTAVHEMGHGFNLAHSWQKHLGAPWIPLLSEPEARSFMNYPDNVIGGQEAFFADFEFRFSDQELLFMRHAPARFVQMGNADWFDDHGFRQASVSPAPDLKLELRVNRDKPEFEFLEPAMLEMKLTNISSQPQLLDAAVLSASDEMTVVIKKQGQPARQWSPYARYCRSPERIALASGESIYESMFVAAGQNGWDIASPGIYEVQMILNRSGEDIVSNALKLRIAPPRSYDEEYLAQDLFTEDPGRVLAFDGSEVLTSGREALENIVDRLGDSRAAIHARVALAEPKKKNYKILELNSGQRELTAAFDDQGKFKITKVREESARDELDQALFENAGTARQTLGHIDYKYYVDGFTDWLHDRGDSTAATKKQADLQKTLAACGVKKEVLAECGERQARYKSKKRSS